jgi:hypothetical protein
MKHVLFLALVGGCHFGLGSVELEAGVPVTTDGGGGDARDANVELGGPLDANLVDSARDLGGRPVPDGAAPGKSGWPCAQAGDCDNGLCIDGYCCDDLCDVFDPAFKCRACNVPGSEGHCVDALDGTDPRGLCDEQTKSSCGTDGLCDGKGGCRLWSAGTQCGAAVCASGQVTAPPICDGIGHCLPSGQTAVCDPYVCTADGTGCTQSCTTGGSGCTPSATCDINGHCNGTLGIGQPCSAPAQCQSGFCAQGVCCASDCTGLCRSCAQTGAKGLCLFIPAGQDPLDQCAASTRASCGLDGTCDGAGSCRLWLAGTPCAQRVCSGDSTVAPRFCDGLGTCLPGVPSSCTPYTCDPSTGACFGAPCASDAQCASGSTCKGMKCK